MRKQRIHAGTMAGIILITFMAILSVAPLVYMILMSFTQSRSMTFHLKDLQPDLKNYYTIFLRFRANIGLLGPYSTYILTKI